MAEGGDAGEAFGPTPACDTYLTCLEAAGSDVLDLQNEVYGDGADCWQTPEGALACTEACRAGVVTERTLDPTVMECWTEGAPSSIELLNAIGYTLEIIQGEPERACRTFVGTEGMLFAGQGAAFTIRVGPGYYREDFDCVLDSDATFTCDGDYYGAQGSFNASFGRMTVDAGFYNSSCERFVARIR